MTALLLAGAFGALLAAGGLWAATPVLDDAPREPGDDPSPASVGFTIYP